MHNRCIIWDNLWTSRGGNQVNLCPRLVPRVLNLCPKGGLQPKGFSEGKQEAVDRGLPEENPKEAFNLPLGHRLDNLWKSRGGIMVNGAPMEVPKSTQWTP